MSVIRVQKSKNFTVMSNTHLFDKNLSLKAAGLLSKILALPDNWNYSIKGLCAICKENETAVKNALNELRDRRYVIVERIEPSKETGGRIQYEYFVYEQPQGEENKKVDVKEVYKAKQERENQSLKKQGLENLGVERLSVENQGDILNTNISNTNKRNTDEANTNKSNTDNKKHSPSELNTSFQRKEGSTPTGLNTPLSGKSGGRDQKDNKPTELKWPAVRNHIITCMVKFGYGKDAKETEAAVDVFRCYYKLYKKKTGREHPVLNDRTMMSVLARFLDGSKEVMGGDSEEHMALMGEHFTTTYGQDIDWNIQHFMTEDIRNLLYYRMNR